MKACSFFGHRDFEPTIEMEEKVYAIIENLIVEKGVKRFLFGSKSNFDMRRKRVLKRITFLYHRFMRTVRATVF